MKKAIVCVGLIGVVLAFIGCDVEPLSKGQSADNSIQGILADVVVMHEDNSSVTAMLKFEDGRIQKLRMNYHDTFCFQTGKQNIVQYDNWGNIQKVDIK